MSSKFTVMLCVHRSPALLPFAMQTVLRQSHANFELFVVSDGSPPETIACANAFAARDPRVRVFDFPKGERNGEANRHVALAEATGEFVAHIADDDLWFPDHLKELGALLEQVELGNLILTTVQPDGSFSFHPGDLADPGTRERMLNERWNFFGPTVAGYRLSTYRRLPVGWSPAPSDVWPDLHMWRKFLRLDGIKVATRFSIQSIAIRASQRAGITMQDRRTESEPWFNIVSDPDACSRLRAQIQEAMARHHAATTQQSLQRKKEIEALVQRAAELKKHVSERDTEIARRGKQVAERDAELVRLRSKVTNKDAALARLRMAAKGGRAEGGDAQADRAGDAAAGTPPARRFDR